MTNSQQATTKIKHPTQPGDYLVINLEDFDPKVHQKYEDEGQASCKDGICELPGATATTFSGFAPVGEAKQGQGQLSDKEAHPEHGTEAKPVTHKRGKKTAKADS